MMVFYSIKGGLLALLFFFTFSYAVDWDKELQDLVHNRNYAKALAKISASKVVSAYDEWSFGRIAGRLIKFTVGGILWSGVFYVSTELLNDYISQKLENASNNNNYGARYPFCLYYLSCDSRVSDQDSYVLTGFSGSLTFPAFVSSQGIPGANFCSGTVNFYDNGSTSNHSFNIYVEPGFLHFLQSYPCPNQYDPNNEYKYQSAADVVNDPANYQDIQDLINRSPSVADDDDTVPSIDGGSVSDYTIERLIGGGYTLVETPSGFSVRSPSGAIIPATKIGDKIKFSDGDKEYTYDIGSGKLTYVDTTTNEVNEVNDTTNSTTTITNIDGTTYEIDWGTYTTPGGLDVPKLDTKIDVPEKKSLTDLITTQISNIPALQILRQVQVSGSGECSFSIPFSLGSASGSGTIDFCQFSSIFSIIGSFILSFAHLFAIYIVFKGD